MPIAESEVPDTGGRRKVFMKEKITYTNDQF